MLITYGAHVGDRARAGPRRPVGPPPPPQPARRAADPSADLEQTDIVCDYIRNGGDKAGFLARFKDAHSPGFDPDINLQRVGVANQTTMLRSETEEIQRRIRAAIAARDGHTTNFRFFDTICGATQERQDALFRLLDESLDLLVVVGGYNSSNTTHLAEIGEKTLPTWFIRNSGCMVSAHEIRHFDIHKKEEVTSADLASVEDPPLCWDYRRRQLSKQPDRGNHQSRTGAAKRTRHRGCVRRWLHIASSESNWPFTLEKLRRLSASSRDFSRVSA